MVAAPADSPIHPAREREAAEAFARKRGIRHILLQSREIDQADFLANHRDRCYVCKKKLFEDLLDVAAGMGIRWVAHGANLDDLEDLRPGMAAAREMKILAPLIEAEMTKEDIRLFSKEMQLATWNKPSMACLASRIPYGTRITRRALQMVDEAENALLRRGFVTCRVRHHGEVARIEIDPADLGKILDEKIRKPIVSELQKIGFLHVSVDLEGYVQGSMNRSI